MSAHLPRGEGEAITQATVQATAQATAQVAARPNALLSSRLFFNTVPTIGPPSTLYNGKGLRGEGGPSSCLKNIPFLFSVVPPLLLLNVISLFLW